MKIGFIEFILGQLALYMFLWAVNDYVASLLCTIIPVIITAILILSFIFDIVEPSGISKRYYAYMAISVIIPIITLIGYMMFFNFQLDWFK